MCLINFAKLKAISLGVDTLSFVIYTLTVRHTIFREKKERTIGMHRHLKLKFHWFCFDSSGSFSGNICFCHSDR